MLANTYPGSDGAYTLVVPIRSVLPQHGVDYGHHIRRPGDNGDELGGDMQPCAVCGGSGVDAAGYCLECRSYRGPVDQFPPPTGRGSTNQTPGPTAQPNLPTGAYPTVGTAYQAGTHTHSGGYRRIAPQSPAGQPGPPQQPVDRSGGYRSGEYRSTPGGPGSGEYRSTSGEYRSTSGEYRTAGHRSGEYRSV